MKSSANTTSIKCPLTGVTANIDKIIKLGQYDVGYVGQSDLWTTLTIPDSNVLQEAYQSFDAGQLARDNYDEYVTLSEAILPTQLAKAGFDTSNLKGLHLLDYGCGGAHYVAAAKRLGINAVGMELDDVSVRAAVAKGLDVRSGVLPKDVEKFANERFDIIMSSHVLEHVPSPRELVESLLTLLKPHGLLLISVPNQKSFPSILKTFLRVFGIKRGEYGFVQPPIHLHGFSAKSFYELSRHEPLEVLFVDNYSPLDVKSFPTTKNYWRGLFVQKIVYMIGRGLGSGGYMTIAMRKTS